MTLRKIIEQIEAGIELNYGIGEGLFQTPEKNLLTDLIFFNYNEEYNFGLNLKENFHYTSRIKPLQENTEIISDYFLFNYKGHDDIYELLCFDNELQLKESIISNIQNNISGFTVFTIPIIFKVAKKIKLTFLNLKNNKNEVLDLKRLLNYYDNENNDKYLCEYTMGIKRLQNINLELV